MMSFVIEAKTLRGTAALKKVCKGMRRGQGINQTLISEQPLTVRFNLATIQMRTNINMEVVHKVFIPMMKGRRAKLNVDYEMREDDA